MRFVPWRFSLQNNTIYTILKNNVRINNTSVNYGRTTGIKCISYVQSSRQPEDGLHIRQAGTVVPREVDSLMQVQDVKETAFRTSTWIAVELRGGGGVCGLNSLILLTHTGDRIYLGQITENVKSTERTIVIYNIPLRESARHWRKCNGANVPVPVPSLPQMLISFRCRRGGFRLFKFASSTPMTFPSTHVIGFTRFELFNQNK